MSVIPPIVLYSKPLFKNAEVAIPEGDWTWEQFATIAEQLQRVDGTKGKNIVSFPAIDRLMSALVLSNGGSYLSADDPYYAIKRAAIGHTVKDTYDINYKS